MARTILCCADCGVHVGLPPGSVHICGEALSTYQLLTRVRREIERRYPNPRDRRLAYLGRSDYFIALANQCQDEIWDAQAQQCR